MKFQSTLGGDDVDHDPHHN